MTISGAVLAVYSIRHDFLAVRSYERQDPTSDGVNGQHTSLGDVAGIRAADAAWLDRNQHLTRVGVGTSRGTLHLVPRDVTRIAQ